MGYITHKFSPMWPIWLQLGCLLYPLLIVGLCTNLTSIMHFCMGIPMKTYTWPFHKDFMVQGQGKFTNYWRVSIDSNKHQESGMQSLQDISYLMDSIPLPMIHFFYQRSGSYFPLSHCLCWWHFDYWSIYTTHWEIQAIPSLCFTIKDLGHAKFFLGMAFARGQDGTSLN